MAGYYQYLRAEVSYGRYGHVCIFGFGRRSGWYVRPFIVGHFFGITGGNLKIGLLFATIFPVVLVFVLFVLKRMVKNPLSK